MNAPSPLFSRGSWLESSRIANVLRAETTGGILLIIGAVLALVWANSPWSDSYAALRDVHVGPESLGLDLSLGHWASDGLLAIFFFVVGLELKREFVAGDLRDPRRAALPMVAAVGGMIAPAIIFTIIQVTTASGATGGWAVPTATDIAFAVAVLAVIGSHLPSGLRTFLLTLAVVDDLLGITVIAIFYTDQLHLQYLAAAAVPLVLFTVLVQKRIRSPWLLVPLFIATWALMYHSGVHSTVAGVLLGFTVPVLRKDGNDGPGMAEYIEHRVRPLSAGFAVPVFAFFAAGVTVGGFSGFVDALKEPVTLGVIFGLVCGKIIGITGSTWLLSTFTKAELDDELTWTDVVGLSMLAGIGFTVSLLIGELAFGEGSAFDDDVKIGVLTGSVIAALLAAVTLRTRNRAYRHLEQVETADTNHDGVPDVFEDDSDR